MFVNWYYYYYYYYYYYFLCFHCIPLYVFSWQPALDICNSAHSIKRINLIFN